MIIKQHPQFPLVLLNYPPYTHEWTEFTLRCRGLIIDKDKNEVVARPFKKFFNLHETPPPPSTAGLLYDKLDGSLIIAADSRYGKIVATRGSFESDQAIAARKYIKDLKGGYTYLFELIGPDNTVVVHYPKNELVLLAMIHTENDIEVPYENLDSSYKIVGARPCNSDDLPDTFDANFEGYVWKCGDFRVKVKSPEYLERHRYKFQLTSRYIYEALSNGTLDIDLIPPGIAQDIIPIIDKYVKEYTYHSNQIDILFNNLKKYLNRKEYAAFALKTPYSAALFRKYDGKEPNVWAYVECT